MKIKELDYQISNDYDRHRDAMRTLWKRAYGHTNDALFDSYYSGNPYGPPSLGLCYDGSELVGQENYISQKVAFSGKIYQGAVGIDTVVAPEYRLFHGVFGKLCKLTMDHMSKSHDLLCALPNEASKKYYIKYFNWKISAKIEIYKKVINTSGLKAESLLSFIRPGKFFKDVKVENIDKYVSEIFDPLIEDYRSKARRIYFYKSAAFLNWKFIQNKHYKTTGYAIKARGVLVGYMITYDSGIERRVLDFMINGDDIGILRKALLTLCKMAKAEGLQRIVIHATSDAWYKPMLKNLFFIQTAESEYVTASFNENLPKSGWIVHCGDFDFF